MGDSCIVATAGACGRWMAIWLEWLLSSPLATVYSWWSLRPSSPMKACGAAVQLGPSPPGPPGDGDDDEGGRSVVITTKALVAFERLCNTNRGFWSFLLLLDFLAKRLIQQNSPDWSETSVYITLQRLQISRGDNQPIKVHRNAVIKNQAIGTL